MHNLAYSRHDIIDVNRKCISLMWDVRNKYGTEQLSIVLSAPVSPHGDGYNPKMIMTTEEASAYHPAKIKILTQTDISMITGLTLNYPNESIGLGRAAKEVALPIVISFTVEQSGNLITGQILKEAIELVDKTTLRLPIYHMVNCVHRTKFTHVFNPEENRVKIIHDVKGNASKEALLNLIIVQN